MTRLVLLFLAISAVACGERAGPGPGPVDPEEPCEAPSDCGCWECWCEGYETPGGAQLCVSGECPTGAEACEAVCAIVGAKVTQANNVETCPAVP